MFGKYNAYELTQKLKQCESDYYYYLFDNLFNENFSRITVNNKIIVIDSNF